VEGHEDEISSITLRRGPCFGTCPVYEVTLRSDGLATWDGERFVQRVGRYTGEIGLEEYGRLARFVHRAGFFRWEDEYVTNVADLPDYFLTGGVSRAFKTVRQNGTDEPPDFWVIATLVDALAATVHWTAPGECRDWSAFHGSRPPAPKVLTVTGTCRFNTTGWSVELRRHEPQGINPSDLLLDRVVHAPEASGEAITDVAVRYEHETDFEYETVTILPDGPSIPVGKIG
jgi:hypothetical protein